MKYAVFALLLASLGCGGLTKPSDVPEGKQVVYFRDDRTGFCFAGGASYSHGGCAIYSIANVPCHV